jgi:AcrR family transcriptional regulator
MTSNGNSVNIGIGKRPYHHGDLRSALVATGLEMLAQGTVEHVSLREIARRAGVSATAVYRHFPEKGALLLALAAAGHEQLGAEQAIAAAQGGAAGFAATGQAYVRFALANPALFRLMFASTPMQVHSGQTLPEGSAAWLLHQGVVHSLPANATPETVFAGMLRAWSLVHGLAMLILDQQIERGTAEVMIESIIGADTLKLG